MVMRTMSEAAAARRPTYSSELGRNQMAWREKAERLIAEACLEAYRKTNTKPDGTRYRKHRPYAVPEHAQALLEALNADDEQKAKSIMLHTYEFRR